MPRLEWRMLEVGHCLHLECSAMRGGRWSVCEFPSLVGLLRHPARGWILFDTGYSQRFLDATARLPGAMYRWVTPVRFDSRRALASQLRELNIDPDEIGGIVLSHFHADHVAGVLDFPGVPLFCSRAGWEAMRSRGRLAALRIGLLPELAPETLVGRVKFFEDLPAASYKGLTGYDLFGDRSLVALELPGHSAGHFGVQFKGSDDRDVMLIGDASWSTRAIRENRPPPAWTTGWLGSTSVYRQTLGNLHALSRAMPDLQLVPSHCREWRP